MSATAADRKEIVMYWTLVEVDGARFTLAAAEGGLSFVSLTEDPYAELLAWANRRVPQARLARDDARLAGFAEQLTEYFRGERRSFSLPLELIGTDFQRKVWRALTDIPYGETRTYGELAASIGSPQAGRAVGTASGANPIPIVVPCHRVIGKDGTLTGYRGGMALKERLLRLEGITTVIPKGHDRFRF